MLTAGQYLASRWWGPDQPACPAEAVDDATPWQSLHSSAGSISQISSHFLRGVRSLVFLYGAQSLSRI